jgi:hypothetical protein
LFNCGKKPQLKGGTLFKTLHKSNDEDFQLWKKATVEKSSMQIRVPRESTVEDFSTVAFFHS